MIKENIKRFIFFYIIILFFVILNSSIRGQENPSNKPNQKSIWFKSSNENKKSGSIIGVVKDDNGNLLSGANVIIEGTRIGDETDHGGNFSINNLPAGNYKLTASYIGYTSIPVNVRLTENTPVYVNIVLKPYSFLIGGIEVIGNKNLLPDEIPTQTVITSGEIEHYQALSVKDVLDLVPGIQKSDNPDLDQISRVALRSDEVNRTSAFGTQLIIDNMPVSNNANLQFENNFKGNLSNVGGGIDIRNIPADNIELIEVVTGLPSVKYGDMTEGIIKIKTKTGKQPNRLKIKSNPGTREGNFSGGFSLQKSFISYNVNYARSERDKRVSGDEYSRLTFQSVCSNSFLDGSLNLNNKITAQKIFDDQAVSGDLLKLRNYDRGYSAGFSSWGDMKFSGNTSVEYSAYVNFRKQNSLKERLVIADYRILPNGDTVSNYVGRVESRGNEWNIGGHLDFKKKYLTNKMIHNVLLGTEVKYDANTGAGVVFDTLFNYYGPESGIRPYSFDEIPGFLNASIYAEDKISGKLFLNYLLQFGFRYEMYRPVKFNFSGLWGDGNLVKSHNGSFFNPRISLLLSLSKNNQLRLSAGKTSKSPALSTLFPRYKTYGWRNPADGTIYHLRYNLHVPGLSGITENQFEASYDFSLFNMIGFSLTGYYKERKNENEGVGAETAAGQDIPVFITVPNSNKKLEVVYLGSFKLSENLGWSFMKGIELKIKTINIKPLNMKFQATGSYNYFNSSRNGTAFYSNPDINKGQYPNYKVPNTTVDTLFGFVSVPPGKKQNKLQFNYYLTYTLEQLGLWVTLRAEQVALENYRNYNLIPVYSTSADGSFEKVNPDEKTINFGDKWLFNLNISKSLYNGAEVSFYVNNFLDDNADGRNPKLFYGIEFSSILDDLF